MDVERLGLPSGKDSHFHISAMWRRIAPVLLAAGLISIACAVLVLLPVSKQASSTRRLREDVLIGASEIASRLPAPKARRSVETI